MKYKKYQPLGDVPWIREIGMQLLESLPCTLLE